MIKKINSKVSKSIINKIVSYECEVDDEIFIDYVFFEFSDKFSFGIHVDSTGENIEFINDKKIEASIKSTGISYRTSEIIKDPKAFKNFSYKFSDIDELQEMNFFLDSITLNISLHLDTIKIEKHIS